MDHNIDSYIRVIKFEDLKNVVVHANAIFDKLKKKYSKLSGYLVYSSTTGQCELTTQPMKILKEFPEMIVDSQHKQKALEIVKIIFALEADKKGSEIKASPRQTLEKVKSDFMHAISNLAVKEETFIEIRFKRVDLDSIYKMQTDELVSQELTPQTKSSVRIVLGTLGELIHERKEN